MGAALRAVRRALRPGAVFAAIVVPHSALNPEAVVRRAAGLPAPPPEAPNPQRLGAPGRLESEFRAAGFADVAVRSVAHVNSFPSVDAFVQGLSRNANTMHLLDQLDDARREHVLRAVEEDVARFATPDGVRFPWELLVGRGEA